MAVLTRSCAVLFRECVTCLRSRHAQQAGSNLQNSLDISSFCADVGWSIGIGILTAASLRSRPNIQPMEADMRDGREHYDLNMREA